MEMVCVYQANVSAWKVLQEIDVKIKNAQITAQAMDCALTDYVNVKEDLMEKIALI